MIAEHAGRHPIEPDLPPDRKLRNRIILANVIAWVAIILLARFIFF
jgi:hypothetical protein